MNTRCLKVILTGAFKVQILIKSQKFANNCVYLRFKNCIQGYIQIKLKQELKLKVRRISYKQNNFDLRYVGIDFKVNNINILYIYIHTLYYITRVLCPPPT